MAPVRKQNISPPIIKGWTRRLIFGEVKNGFQLQLRHLPKHQESNSHPPNLCACRGIPQQQKTGQKVAPKRMGNFHPTDKNPKDKINTPAIPSRDIKFHFMWGRHLQKLFNLTSLQLSFHPKSDAWPHPIFLITGLCLGLPQLPWRFWWCGFAVIQIKQRHRECWH